MSIVDLHPENLLDKDIRGQLDDDERGRLEAHLGQCATCRLERQLRADFALEVSRDSVSPDISRLVDELAKNGPPPATPTTAPRLAKPLRGSRARRLQLVGLAAAATLTLVVGAFASTESGRRVLSPWFRRPTPSSTLSEAASVVAIPRSHGGAPAVAPTAIADPPATQPPAAPPAMDAPSPVSGPLPARVAAPEGPAHLFDAEADARRRGDLARVLALHSRLVARYPASHEAQVSRMMVARMLLDRGEPAEALPGFEAYLRNGAGELREDALAGRATSLRARGRRSSTSTRTPRTGLTPGRASRRRAASAECGASRRGAFDWSWSPA
jgi:hypothetical protein